jgi:hypothetical protein
VAAYGLLLQEFPQSRYLLPVGASLLSIHLAKDDVPGATRALEPVLAAGKSGADEALVAALGSCAAAWPRSRSSSIKPKGLHGRRARDQGRA